MAKADDGRLVIRLDKEARDAFKKIVERMGHSDQFVGEKLVRTWLALKDDDERRAVLFNHPKKSHILPVLSTHDNKPK